MITNILHYYSLVKDFLNGTNFEKRAKYLSKKLPIKNSIRIGNHYYKSNSEHITFKWEESLDYINDLYLLEDFSNLKSASFSGSNLNDEGLDFVSNCKNIENLNLQETEITNEGIKHLKKLKKLKCLRLKENPQLTNDCVPYLIELENLKELQIHETSINRFGISQLTKMKYLKEIIVDVWEENYILEELIKLSEQIPECLIVAKGKGTFYSGKFNGEW